MGAVGAGLSIVGSLAGMSQQSANAKAQKRALASQQEQQALQSQLQYLSLKNQTASDKVTDSVNDSLRSLSYQQSVANTNSQQQLNNVAINSALFDASVQRSQAAANKTGADTQAQLQQSQANEQVGNQQLQAEAAAFGVNGQDLSSILASLGKGDSQSAAIAQLLDIASSSGGVNEALRLLGGDNQNQTTVAQADLIRSQELAAAKVGNAGSVADANRQLNAATATTAGSVSNIGMTQQVADANAKTLDATTSKTVADAGFNATRAANKAVNNIGIISDNSASFSRNYLNKANQSAVSKGAVLQQQITQAQQAQIKSPGFFDLLGVGANAYQTYNRLK